MRNKVYVSDNSIYINVKEDEFIRYKGTKKIKLDLNNAEEITNETIINTLINEHNNHITKSLLKISKNKDNKYKRYQFLVKDEKDENLEIECSLYDALIDMESR